MTFRTADSFVARKATAQDYHKIEQLIQSTWQVQSRNYSLEDIKNRLKTDVAFVVDDKDYGYLRGFIMVEPQPPETGLIVQLAVDDNTDPNLFLRKVLPAVEAEMAARYLERLVQVGSRDWLKDYLPKYGFKVRSQIKTLEWKPQSLPAFTPHPTLKIRPAHLNDLAKLMILDELAFGPLWRKPRRTFRAALAQAASFSVGLVDDSLVAYEWSDMVEDHAHITRLGTHPHYQGQGIGGHMLGHTLQALLDMGANIISLNTQVDNIRSQELYARFGFKETGHIANVYQKRISPTKSE